MDTRRAWWIWGTGVFAYLVAITQRTSFGVAGLHATERFDATAAALSTFTVVQLLVYAGLQIPVGLMVDRFGPRFMITGGAVPSDCVDNDNMFRRQFPYLATDN